MRQAHRRDAAFFFQIEAHERLSCVRVPVREPCDDEQARTRDAAVFADDAEGFAAHACAAHHAFAPRTQIRPHMGRLEPTFGSPPLHCLCGIGQRRRDPFCWSRDRDLLDDGFVCAVLIHRGAVVVRDDQAHGLQHAKALRDRRTAGAKVPGELPDRMPAAAEQAEHLAPGRIPCRRCRGGLLAPTFPPIGPSTLTMSVARRSGQREASKASAR
jgi:hypothetical protein